MHKVLLDMSCAMTKMGFAGITQDARLLFKTFIYNNNINFSAFVYPDYGSSSCLDDKYKNNLLEQGKLLSNYIDNNIEKKSFLEKVKSKCNRIKWLFKSQQEFTWINHNVFPGFMWEYFFKNSLEFSDITIGNNVDFGISTTAHTALIDRARFCLPRIKLNAEGYDFVIFQDIRYFNVIGGAYKIIRYHDAIPFLFPSFNPHWIGQLHKALLKSIKKYNDSYFVCNSKTSAKQAISLVPSLEKKIAVVPCVLPVGNKPIYNKRALPEIIAKNLCDFVLSESDKSIVMRDIRNKKNIFPQYILAVSTIEPRKNYIRLIQAWEEFRAITGKDIRLIIVGSPGWMNDKIKEAMRPHVSRGILYHLAGVPITELRVLYSHALVLVSASNSEGFGLTPMEAMQCNCPTLVSDIPAHREIMGNASEFFLPYSIESLRNKLLEILNTDNYELVRNKLIIHGQKRIKLYSIERIGEMWTTVFDRIKSKNDLQL